jgi:hypothetical protein
MKPFAPLLAMLALLALGSWAQVPEVSVPHTFVSGTSISAAEMNQDFQALVNAIKAQVLPIGSVIASFVAPGADGYMSGTTDQVWAFADGSKPASAGSYTGPFPDMRGQFIRGLNAGASVDPAAGRVAGDAEADAFQGHMHTTAVSGGGSQWTALQLGAGGTASTPPPTANLGIFGNGVGGGYAADGALGAPRPASETRPTNVAVYWYIKVR